ncbi:MAG TPA: LicD family protein [Croceibacterium sp.]|nr:LicD family protein [Croceibacterium sp.]
MIAYRDGRPSPDLLRLQHQHKRLLRLLAATCERHGLRFFLAAGSALGAVRHGDVIPWDDDIDVGMLRPDYDRLCRLLAREPIPGTFLQHWDSEPGYPLPFAKLRLDGSFIDDAEFDATGFHRGISIDVFPYEPLPRSTLAVWLQRYGLGLLNLLILPPLYEGAAAPRSRPRRALKALAVKARAVVPLRPLVRAREWLLRMEVLPKGEWADCYAMFGVSSHRRTMVRRRDLEPPSMGRFGGDAVPLPADTDAYLARLYGDYMQPPAEDRRVPLHTGRVDFPSDATKTPKW